MEEWLLRHSRSVCPIRDYQVVLALGNTIPPRQTPGTRILHEEIIAAYLSESSEGGYSRVLEQNDTEAIEVSATSIDEAIAEAVFASLRDTYPAVPEEALKEVLIECSPRVLKEGWVSEAFTRSWDDDTEPRFGIVKNVESLVEALALYRKVFFGEKPACQGEVDDWLNELGDRVEQYWERIPDVEHSVELKSYDCLVNSIRCLAPHDFAATSQLFDRLYLLWTKIVLTYEEEGTNDITTAEGAGQDSTIPSFVACLSNEVSRAVVDSQASPGFASPDRIARVVRGKDEEEGVEENEIACNSWDLLSEAILEYCYQLQELKSAGEEVGKPPQRDMDHMQSILTASQNWLKRASPDEEEQARMMLQMLHCMWENLQDKRDIKPQVIECIPNYERTQIYHTAFRQTRHKRRKLSISSEIFQAIKYGDLEWVSELHDQGIDMNKLDRKFGQSPMHEAAVLEDVAMMECLCRRGASPWVRSETDELPLHAACWYGSETSNVVEWLVVRMGPQHTPDIWKGFHGRTPLHFACFKGNRQVVEYLFRTFPSKDLLNLRDHDGLTAWHYAKLGHHFDLAKFLVDKGADDSDHGRFDPCSLHQACATGRLGLVVWLKEHMLGTQNLLHEQNSDGFTPMECAGTFGHHDVVQFLREWQEEEIKVSTDFSSEWPL